MELKTRGIHTTVETAGLLYWEAFESLHEDIDLFLFDVKHFIEEAHRFGTGKSNKKILENLKHLKQKGSNIIIRYPLIPGYRLVSTDISAVLNFMKEENFDTIHLLPYHRLGRDKYERLGWNYEMTELASPNKEEVAKVESFFAQKNHLNVIIGG